MMLEGIIRSLGRGGGVPEENLPEDGLEGSNRETVISFFVRSPSCLWSLLSTHSQIFFRQTAVLSAQLPTLVEPEDLDASSASYYL